VDPPDRAGELVGLGVLRQVAAGPGPERGEDRLVVGVRRQDDDLDRGVGVPYGAGRLDAVELRHPQVHEDDVGLELAHQVERLTPVLRGAHRLDAGRRPQQQRQPFPNDALVVDHEHLDRHVASWVTAPLD
jgi:hypothetical protein